MPGYCDPQSSWFNYVDLESRIPKQRPIRKIRKIAEQALEDLEPEFDAICAGASMPSIPPECLIRATSPQILFTIHSERQLCDRIDYDRMFR